MEKSIKELQKEKKILEFKIPEVLVERPREKTHGDYSTNIVLKITKIAKKEPRELAKIIKEKLKDQKLEIFEKIEIISPGFINFFIKKEYLQNQVKEILKQKNKFGDLKIGKKEKINIEFISANPTGPLTLGNGRGGFGGDVLSNVLEKAGYKVTREYYINDIGNQVKMLGHSVMGDLEAVYKGKYIDDLREKINGSNPQKVGEKAASIILKEMIKPSVKKMKIKFDKWFSEKSLYKFSVINLILNKKDVDRVVRMMKVKDLIYNKDSAVWFKSTKFGDDKDRVLIKKNNEKTYLVSDILYLKNKFDRGFKKIIFFWGADHYGYINRMKAAVQALGYKKEQIDIMILQLVRLFENGKEVRMSKRTKTYVTMDELIDKVGLDATRFFFLMRSLDTHFNFDLDLAREQSQKNPVFYVQYACARICSILCKSKSPISSRIIDKVGTMPNFKKDLKLELLNDESELELIKQLIRFPAVVEDMAKDYQIQRLPQYAIDLADCFHCFYENCKVISENKDLTSARLCLVSAVKIVLKNTLDLMGIGAPEKM
ncbi:MAG: arginine--tRNA ligase [Candidatus Nealsonbacteria bacterium]